MNKLIAGLVTVAVVVCAGCGKSPKEASTADASGKASTAAPTNVDSSLPTIARNASSDRHDQFIDMSWKTLPSDEFQKVDSQIRRLYWSGAVKDEQKLAEDFSPEYRREKDAFKKAELLKQLSGPLNADFDDAQKDKDYSVRTDMQVLKISPYDPQAGGFKVLLLEDLERQEIGMPKDVDRTVNNQRWLIRFVGVPLEKVIVVKRSDQEARQIESHLAALRPQANAEVFAGGQFQGSIVGTFHSVGHFSDVGLFRVDSVTAVDKTGQPILTISPAELGIAEIRCRSTREALHLREPTYSGVNQFPPPDC